MSTHLIERCVEVEVDLADFDTEDLLQEIEERGKEALGPPSREKVERLYYATRTINGSGVIPPSLTRDIVDLLAALYGRAV